MQSYLIKSNKIHSWPSSSKLNSAPGDREMSLLWDDFEHYS